MAEWTWEPDDFAALWFGDAYDRFPSPLRYTSRFALRDQFTAHRHAVLGRYSADELDEIKLALHTLGTADVRIEILGGTSKHKNSMGPRDFREYRILGARNSYHAVTLMQAGTETENGTIRVRMFRPEHLPARIAGAVPARTAGAEQPATFHPDDLGSRHDGYSEDPVRDSARRRYRRLIGGPADGGGSAVLLAGPPQQQAKPWNVLQWHDITDDGRYTEVRGRHITVRPTTHTELTAQFTAWIDRALARLEQARNEHHP